MTSLELHDFPDEMSDEERYRLPAVAVDMWFHVGIVMLVFGTIGHLLLLLVLLGSKRMRTVSLSVYVVASSIAGLCSLYVGLLRHILMSVDKYGYNDPRDRLSDVGCRIHAALTYYSLQLFAWLQASVAVERTIAVWRPMHYKRWCTRERNAIIVVSIAVVLALCNVVVIVSFRNDGKSGCRPSASRHHVYLFDTVWGWLDLVLYSLFPGAVILPCNAFTIYRMFRSRAYRRSTNASFSLRKSRQFTVMLLAHNAVFVITTLPVSIIFLLPVPPSDQVEELEDSRLAWTVCSLLQYLGTTLGFVVYSSVAEKFRKAINELFCKGFNAEVSSESAASGSAKSLRQAEPGSSMRLRSMSQGHCPLTPQTSSSQTTQLDDEEAAHVQ